MRDILKHLDGLDSDLVDEMVPFNKEHFGGSEFVTILDESDLEVLSDITLMERYNRQLPYDAKDDARLLAEEEERRMLE